jgi:HAE1 family hydrophobic/amphiphilic exporter-1
MRQALGIGVFSGIMGVTLFGLVATPVFYIVCRILAERAQGLLRRPPGTPSVEPVPQPAEWACGSKGWRFLLR